MSSFSGGDSKADKKYPAFAPAGATAAGHEPRPFLPSAEEAVSREAAHFPDSSSYHIGGAYQSASFKNSSKPDDGRLSAGEVVTNPALSFPSSSSYHDVAPRRSVSFHIDGEAKGEGATDGFPRSALLASLSGEGTPPPSLSSRSFLPTVTLRSSESGSTEDVPILARLRSEKTAARNKSGEPRVATDGSNDRSARVGTLAAETHKWKERLHDKIVHDKHGYGTLREGSDSDDDEVDWKGRFFRWHKE